MAQGEWVIVALFTDRQFIRLAKVTIELMSHPSSLKPFDQTLYPFYTLFPVHTLRRVLLIADPLATEEATLVNLHICALTFSVQGWLEQLTQSTVLACTCAGGGRHSLI